MRARKRVFTRRRHAVRSAHVWLRMAIWFGLPLVALMSYVEIALGAVVPTASLWTAFAAFFVWSVSVLRTRDLTGEWRFF